MEERVIDLKEVYASLVENRKIIIRTTIGFMLLGGLYLIVVPPTYQSTALIRIQQEQGIGSSLLQSVTGGNAQLTTQRMQTNAEILKSRNVVIPVIEATEELDDGKYPEYEDYVKDHITTKPFKDTELLEVAVTAKTAEKAQEVNNMIVKGFIKRLGELSQAQKKQVREFLQKRSETAKQELADTEEKLQAYQVANQMYSANDQIKSFTDKVALADRTKAESQLNLDTAQASLDSINGQLDSAGKSIADSPAIQQYKTQLAQLASEKASYIGKFTNEHPKMQEVNERITQLNSSLNEEVERIINREAPSSSSVQQGLLASKFKNEAIIAAEQSKLATLNAMESENNKTLAELPAKEQGYIRVKRDADVAQEIYIMLAKRLEEAKVAEVMVPSEIQVVDSATLPDKPIAPRKKLTLAIMMILGFMLSSLYIVARDLFNKKVTTTEDVEALLNIPVIGIIPDAMQNIEQDEERNSLKDKLRRLLWKK